MNRPRGPVRRRWRAWRTQRWLLTVVKVIALAPLVVYAVVEGGIPEPAERTPGRRNVSLINKLSLPPRPVSGGWFGRIVRLVDNHEVRGHLTVDPDHGVFLWEAEDRDARSRPIALVHEPLATVEVAHRWNYRFGRRTVVVVSLASGAELWLAGSTRDVALQRLR
jgi:hypothetical protein